MSDVSISAAMAMSLGVWYRVQKGLSKKQELIFKKIFHGVIKSKSYGQKSENDFDSNDDIDI